MFLKHNKLTLIFDSRINDIFQTGVSTFYVYPKGLRDLLVYMKEKYNNPTIYITENGILKQLSDHVPKDISQSLI